MLFISPQCSAFAEVFVRVTVAVDKHLTMEAVYPILRQSSKKPAARNKRSEPDLPPDYSSSDSDYESDAEMDLLLVNASADLNDDTINKLVEFDVEDEKSYNFPLTITEAKCMCIDMLLWLCCDVAMLCSAPS